jgi:hypothetical protein
MQQASQRQAADVERQTTEMQRQGQGYLEQLKGKEAEVKELHRQLQVSGLQVHKLIQIYTTTDGCLTLSALGTQPQAHDGGRSI